MLALDGRQCEQRDIDAFIGASYETFCAVVLHGQFGSTFLDLSPTAKLIAFSSALDLGVWELASDAAAKANVAATAELHRLEGALLALRQRVSTLRERFRKERDAQSSQQAIRKAELRKINRDLYRVDLELTAARDIERESKEQLDAAKKAHARAARDVDSAVVEYAEALAPAALARARWDELKQLIDNPPAVGAPCPTCDRVLDLSHMRGLAKRRGEEINKVEIKMHRLRGVKRELRRQKETAEGALSDAARRCDEAATKLAEAGRQRAQVEAERAGLRRALELLQARPVESSALSAVRSDLRASKAAVAEAEASAARSERRRRAAEYWRGGFRDLRLWIVRRALDELEAASNAALTALGLDGWALHYDVERATADGKGVVRGFTCEVSAPGVEGRVPFEAWSGGETQRLRLAASLGFSELIRARTGLRLGIEIFDEPTTHLSAEGVRALLDFLAERAAAEGSTIWYVDHRSPNYVFSGTITLLRKKSGATVVES